MNLDGVVHDHLCSLSGNEEFEERNEMKHLRKEVHHVVGSQCCRWMEDDW